ncbi:MAG: CHASE domain-containing protein, partial [Candidatus Methylomirabilaceae bacterium]
MSHRAPFGRYLPLVCTVSAGIVLSIAAFVFVGKQERERVQIEFEQQARSRASAIRQRVNEYPDTLHSIAGLYAASQEVDRQEFREFVARALSQLPGIQALIWAPHVPAARRGAYESAARRDGYRDFWISERDTQGEIVRAAQRDTHFPIHYVEPIERNEPALGFDLASSATASQALERARDTGTAAATGRMTLLAGTGEEVGVLVAVPIYRKGRPHQTVDQRRDNLAGLAVGVFRIGDVVEGILKDVPRAGIDVYLYDRSASEGTQLLHVQPSRLRRRPFSPIGEGDVSDVAGLTWGDTFDVAGRHWSLQFRPAPEFLAAHGTWQAWGVLAGGLMFTSMLGAYLLIALGRTARTERAVTQRTVELSRTKEDLEREVEERKQIAEALRESEKRSRTLLEASADAILVYDATAHVTYLNPAFVRTFGWSQDDLLGKRIDFVPEENRAETKAAIEQLRRGAQVLEMETRRRTKDGTLIDVQVSASPLQDGDGSYAGAVVIFRDIGRRRRAEEALRDSEERYRDLVEHSDDLICTHDLEGTLLSANLALVRRLGYERAEELIGRTLTDYLAPDVRELFDEYLDTIAKEGHAQGFMKVVTRDGEERILEYRNSLRTEGLDKPIVRGTAHDVTERRRMDQTRRALYQASLDLQAPFGLQERLDRLLHAAQKLLELDRVNILLADGEARWLQIVASTETAPETIRIPIGPEGGALAQAYQSQRPIIWDGSGPVPEEWRLKPPYDQIEA